jgi:hypothetical protein
VGAYAMTFLRKARPSILMLAGASPRTGISFLVHRVQELFERELEFGITGAPSGNWGSSHERIKKIADELRNRYTFTQTDLTSV